MTTDKLSARIALQTERANEAIAALNAAQTDADKLAAAKALESASCQLRRALKTATA
jgi:hypothetical protein